MENQQQEEQLSHEELMARKEEMKKFYEESVPYLEAQCKYEKLLTDIEEARFKRASFQYQFAMMVGQPSDGNEETDLEESDIPKEVRGRKLKKN